MNEDKTQNKQNFRTTTVPRNTQAPCSNDDSNLEIHNIAWIRQYYSMKYVIRDEEEKKKPNIN